MNDKFLLLESAIIDAEETVMLEGMLEKLTSAVTTAIKRKITKGEINNLNSRLSNGIMMYGKKMNKLPYNNDTRAKRQAFRSAIDKLVKHRNKVRAIAKQHGYKLAQV